MTAFPADGFFAAASNNAEGKQGLDDLLAAAKQLPGGRVESSLTIASGNATPTAGIHSINTEAAAASDDLANILTTNLPDGSVLIIRPASAARVVTVKHQAGGAGQVSLVGSADVVLNATSKFLLLKRTGTGWEEIGRFGFAAFTGGALSTSIEEKKGANVASASTCDIWAPSDGNLIHVTGTTTITSFGTAPQAGAERVVIFDGALTLTHHATTLKLPAGANITTAANDRALVRADTTANMIVIAYVKADGTPIALGDGSVTDAKESADAFSDIASASTTDLGANASRNIRITGTTSITSFGAIAAGRRRKVRMAGALTLTHNATSLILPGGANITTAANDCFDAISLGSGNWIVTNYQRADGTALIDSGGITYGTPVATTSGSSKDFTGLPAGINEIHVTLKGVSKNNTSRLTVQLGESGGGYKTSGYVGASWSGGTFNAMSSGFDINDAVASAAVHGLMILKRHDGHVWTCKSEMARTDSPFVLVSSGSVTLAGDVDRLRLTSTGADTLTAGEFNISYRK